MIPKVIHYCWFGKGQLSELGQQCIASWRKFCPDYEIIRWDESNYNVNQNIYIQQAYEHKKFAFVSDYARLDIIYRYGGIYLDTDVEIIKPFDPLLSDKAFMGFGCTGGVNTGLGFGAEPSLAVIKELRDYYDNLTFVSPGGELDTTPCVKHQSELLSSFGFQDNNSEQIVSGIHIYPSDFFCPMHYLTGIVELTDNTYSIHHYESTHWDKRAKSGMLRVRNAYRKYGKFGGMLFSKFRIVRGIDLLIHNSFPGSKSK